jgi:hypothetical protein
MNNKYYIYLHKGKIVLIMYHTNYKQCIHKEGEKNFFVFLEILSTVAKRRVEEFSVILPVEEGLLHIAARFFFLPASI